MKNSFQLKARLPQVCTLCKSIENLQPVLMCSDKQLFEIVLIVEELCVNVINHGGADNIEVSLEKDWDELKITIRDDGNAFDPTQKPPVNTEAPLDTRCPGGLGLHLVKHYAESFHYQRVDGYNVVTVTMLIK